MNRRLRQRAAALGGGTFVAALVLAAGLATTPGAEADAQAPAPAGSLARVAKMNAAANALAAQRVRREGPSAL